MFEVGTSSLFPQGAGGTAWIEYDYMDQYLNWHAAHIASAANNNDKVLRTNFTTVGLQYMFNRNWGAMIQIPYWQRFYRGAYTGDNANFQSYNWNSIGDIRIEGMYTGFSEDMSTGLVGGLKVPSGWYTYPHVDRDNQIGTGSTDLLFGAYHLGNLPFSLLERPLNWYVQGSYDLPVFTQDHYKPGREFDGALGLIYNWGQIGFLKEFAPLVSLVASDRARDSQSQADPTNTGYSRLLIAPGVETKIGIIRWYTDVGIPVFQNMNGNQITAPYLLKTVLSYDF
ncbi:MAG TPA: hypothetical protein VFB15_03990 [Candidatus Binataceae bacterium]|nr:hypothetical protein [Candidatus Binataceae bacterium]